ncbi:hypothetical protein AMTRI_Chr13g117350 [Amborella trichopoda]
MMSNSTSFRGYGKLDETEQARLEARQKTRKRMTIISLSTIVLVTIVVAVMVGPTQSHAGKQKPDSSSDSRPYYSSIKALCNLAVYPDSCFSSLSPIANVNHLDPESLFKLSLEVALKEISNAASLPEKLTRKLNDTAIAPALEVCSQVLTDAVDQLNITITSVECNSRNLAGILSQENVDDLKSWLSAAITDVETCLEGFEDANQVLVSQIHESLRNSTEFTSNSLAILAGITNVLGSLNIPTHRRLLGHFSGDFPSWITSKDRRLLQSFDPRDAADFVVAKDGSGKYKNISAAIKAVPKQSKKRIVIYVKQGRYVENVVLDKDKWNVMIVGDGMNSTIVTGGLNVIDGTPTFNTATLAVFGKGFIGMDIGFQNIAGPEKHQAVALMVSADQTVCYRCLADGYQDTLYVHKLRQFYKNCTISGTVDFIFGNSAVVFQDCKILAKQPMLGQQITITAQGRTDPNQNTGISIHRCIIAGAQTLKGVESYLGRPWKNYSTTVYMNSMLGDIINPNGWLPWTGNSAPDTIFYGEYGNYGPGSNTSERVKWRGYKKLTTSQANKFTAKSFIHGYKWISTMGVPYSKGL